MTRASPINLCRRIDRGRILPLIRTYIQGAGVAAGSYWRRFLGNSECIHRERGERIWKYRPKSIYPFCGDPSLFIWGQYAVANSSRHGVWADPEFYPTAFGGLGFSEPHQPRVRPFERDTYFGQLGQTTPLRATDRPSSFRELPGWLKCSSCKLRGPLPRDIGYLAFPRLHQSTWACDRLDIQSYKNLIRG